MNGTVEFSRDASCWIYTCAWGCSGWDFEGEYEARAALLSHECRCRC